MALKQEIYSLAGTGKHVLRRRVVPLLSKLLQVINGLSTLLDLRLRSVGLLPLREMSTEEEHKNGPPGSTAALRQAITAAFGSVEQTLQALRACRSMLT